MKDSSITFLKNGKSENVEVAVIKFLMKPTATIGGACNVIHIQHNGGGSGCSSQHHRAFKPSCSLAFKRHNSNTFALELSMLESAQVLSQLNLSLVQTNEHM